MSAAVGRWLLGRLQWWRGQPHHVDLRIRGAQRVDGRGERALGDPSAYERNIRVLEHSLAAL